LRKKEKKRKKRKRKKRKKETRHCHRDLPQPKITVG
jgi:hypothetical protein